jgi:GT2 family glycosyltransferase
MDGPTISVIIASRNRPRLLEDTVESVLGGTQVPDEIVIVDQSDAPHPRLSALTPDRPCTVRYFWSKTVGVSHSRNSAIRAAHGEIIACIDDDMMVDAEWLAVIRGTLVAAGPRTVVTGRVLPAAPEVPGGFVPAVRLSTASATYQGRVMVDPVAGGHMAAYRRALLEIGGFDERLGPGTSFRAAEDNDLGFRLLEAGYCTMFVPEAVVYHRAWRRHTAYFSLRWTYGVGQGAFYAKFLAWGDYHMLRRWGSEVRYYLRHPTRLLCERRWAVGYLIYFLGTLYGAGRWVLTQRIGRRFVG